LQTRTTIGDDNDQELARNGSMSVITSTLEQYQEHGYSAPLRVLSEDEARSYRSALEEREHVRGRPLNRDEIIKPHLLFRWAADLVRHPAVLDAVEAIIGPDILFWDSSLFMKEANSPTYISWHQDLRYWGLDPGDQILTAWIALSPSTVESGCMRVVPGSHRLDLMPHTNTLAANNMLSYGQEVQAQVDEETAADLVLQPGEMSLHHAMIIHGSAPNMSQDRRIGYAIRYLPTRVKQISGWRDWARLVRGVDRFEHFDPEPMPSEYDTPEAHALHAEAHNRRKAAKRSIVIKAAEQVV
jgi:non-haem Fe2+, alpha-ketoglutarate-dependent halogenase